MTIEVLISTMNQKDFSLVDSMNIKSDALIINQCDVDDFKEKKTPFGSIRMISINERGLSKSRNLAIENSHSNICIIADDDLRYHDNYKETILTSYQRHPDADIIVFDVPSTNENRPTSSLKNGNVDFFHSMKISSFQITFKRKSFIEKSIKFNELFGAGSRYTCGEENILLAKSIKKGLRIVYINEPIAIVNHLDSTWFNGFDERLFKTKGAMFFELNELCSNMLIIQFALRKWKLYHNKISFFEAIRYMIGEKNEYQKYLKRIGT